MELVKKRGLLLLSGCAGFQKITRRMLDLGKTTTTSHDKRLICAIQYLIVLWYLNHWSISFSIEQKASSVSISFVQNYNAFFPFLMPRWS